MQDIQKTQASLVATQALLSSQLGRLAEKVDKISDALDGRHSSESDVWRYQGKTSSSSVKTRESARPITFTPLSMDSEDESESRKIPISIPVVSVHAVQDIDSNCEQAQQDVKEVQAAVTTITRKLKKIGSFLVFGMSRFNWTILIFCSQSIGSRG